MKTLIATLVLAMSSFAYAEEMVPEVPVPASPDSGVFQTPLNMSCFMTDKVISMIKDVDEAPIWIGTGVAQSTQSLYTTISTNDKTGSWTVFLTNKEQGFSCIVGYGTTNTDYVKKETL